MACLGDTNQMAEVNSEIRNRIRLSVAAYAYEYCHDSIMNDHDFDELSLKIDPEADTGNALLDNFFRLHFEPSTGMWIRNHPEVVKIMMLYHQYYKG
jgi:hypothetical protein